MAKIQFRDSTTIGDYMVPYFIAEINTSHFGDISLAKDMIKKAKKSVVIISKISIMDCRHPLL